MTNYEILSATGERKVLISKYAKKWEVTPLILHYLINDYVLFGGCEDPIFYTIYTQQDLNKLVSNYLETGKITLKSK